MLLTIEDRAADDPAVGDLVRAAEAELAELYPGPDENYPLNPRIRFVVAFAEGVPVGCAALQPLDPESGSGSSLASGSGSSLASGSGSGSSLVSGSGWAEVKRMFVVPAQRGRGIARRMLVAVEQRAVAAGYAVVRLETGTRQPAAIALYESAGYARTEAYGAYVGNPFSVCFRKEL